MTLAILNPERRAISDPTTGEEIDPTNVDQMAEAFVRLETISREVGNAMKAIRLAFGEMSEGDARTRRVRGEHHRVKLEMPSPTWNQSKLKKAWDEWPALAPEFLRIEKIAPKLREVKKLANESGGSDFAAFRKLLLEAEEPSTAPPRVVIETDTSDEQRQQEWALRGALKASLNESEDQ